MLRLIIWTVIISVGLRIVFRFILPVLRITSATASQMRRMQEQMREAERSSNEPAPAPKRNTRKEGDYIEYEELK